MISVFIFEGINRDALESFRFMFFSIISLTIFLVFAQKYKGVFFEEKDILWIFHGKKYEIKWGDLKIIKKFNYSYFKLIEFNIDKIKNIALSFVG